MIEDANSEWLKTLELVKIRGERASPRDLPTRELLNHIIQWRMNFPVVYEKKRGLSYTFMAAEALWIMSGSDRLDFHPEIEKKLKPYSDDGVHMSGAYGPRIIEQFEWCYVKLLDEPDTRQAVIEIWRPAPGPSKDVPCTLSIQFNVRDNRLYMSVFMRSSDVWMGLPYDIFSFTMLAHAMAYRLGNVSLDIGCITAGSSHLYERDSSKAYDVLYMPRLGPKLRPIPSEDLKPYLKAAANAKTQEDAFEILTKWRTNETA